MISFVCTEVAESVGFDRVDAECASYDQPRDVGIVRTKTDPDVDAGIRVRGVSLSVPLEWNGGSLTRSKR